MCAERLIVVLLAGLATAAAMGQVVEPDAPVQCRTFDHAGAVYADAGHAGGGSAGPRTFPARVVDVTGINSVGVPGNAGNAVVSLLFAPGTKVWGHSAGATFNFFGGPANPGMGFRMRNSAGAQITVNYAPASSPFVINDPPTKVAPGGEITLHDGRLFIEFFEAVDDLANADGTWTSGTIGVLFEDSGECCVWDNGAYDQRTSIPSQDACTRQPPTNRVCVFAADDFYLEPPYVHRIDWLEAVFIVQNPAPAYNYDAPIGKVFLYKDCEGQPGMLVPGYESGFDLFLPRDGLVATLTGGSKVFRVVAPTADLFLDGGKAYWVSFVPTGVTSQGGSDIWYWGSAGSADGVTPPPYVKGSVPHVKQNDPANPWQIVCFDPAAGCGGCTDLNFCIRGERCKIIYDAADFRTFTGTPPPITALGARSINAGGITTQQARAADDVTVSPCETDLYPCLVEAYVWTNCVPPRAQLEIYETQCDPVGNFARPQDNRLFPVTGTINDTSRVDLGFSRPGPGGTTFRLFCFRFTEFSGFQFEAGKTYWISALATGGGTPTNDGYFAFREPRCPEDECYRTGNPGFARSNFDGTPTIYRNWLSTGLLPIAGAQEEDFAMRVAVRHAPPTLTSGALARCVADFDRSGQVTVSDIFAFLSEWFSGCP